MSKEILLVVKSVSNEKGVSVEIIFQALESALEQATKKRYDSDVDIRVSIDRETGDYNTFRRWEVVADEDFEFAGMHLTLDEGLEQDETVGIGSFIEEAVESVQFGRIAAQIAKQVIMQKIREAERSSMIESCRGQLGELVSGSVKKVTRDSFIVDIGNNAEAVLKKDQTLPREMFRVGAHVRSLLYDISADSRGAQLMLSRTNPAMLTELFKIEVPEISEEIIEIKSVARDSGSRSKISVKTNDGRIDPVGSCVGMRGARVQAVSSELGGERIDIVLFDEDPIQYVVNAMQPAEVASIVVDESSQSMDIAVNEANLAQAIGRSGQNIQLASALTDWTLNVMSEKDAIDKQSQESDEARQLFLNVLEAEEFLVDLLISEGFSSLEAVLYAPKEELIAIGLSEEQFGDLRQKAKEYLLAQAIEQDTPQPSQDLLQMKEMNKDLAVELANIGITTMEHLAEQSVDDLVDVKGLNEDVAARLIMEARAPWFEESNS